MEALAFTSPALLWGLLAAAIPLLIHLISRRRARRIAFAAVEFLLRARQQRARQLRLKQLLLLLLRTAVVALVALAITRPLLRPREVAAVASDGRSATAIVLDASLSMRYRLGNRTLFERAQSEARSLVEALPAEAPATLVVCDGTTPEAEPPGFDRVGLKQRISAASAGFRPADVTGCMAAAARALGESPLEGKKLYVVSDLTLPSLRLDAPPPRVPTPAGEILPEIVFLDVARGESLPNLAVVGVTLSPSAALGTRGFEVAATVRNSAERPAENVAVALKVAGQVVTRGYVDVPPRGTARKVLAHRFEPGTQLAEVVLPEDPLVEDDAFPLLLHVPRDVRALVVDGSPAAVRHRDETFFIDAALGPGRTGGRISTTFLDADAAQARPLQGFDVVLLLNMAAPKSSFVQGLRAFVEGGGGLFLSMGDNVQPDDYNATFGDLLPRPLHLVRTTAEPGATSGPPPARFARVDLQHPAFAVFAGASEGFDSARIFRHVLLQPDARQDERVLATYDDGALALVEARRGRGRVVLFTSTVDRDWTDWPIRTSFLPSIQQLTTYLADALDQRPPEPTLVGEERQLEADGAVELAHVRDPAGSTLRVEGKSVRPERPGHHTVVVKDPAERDSPRLSFAATVDARETDTARFDPDELAEHFGGGGASARVAAGAEGALPRSGTPLWSWLLLAALLAFVAEGVLVRKA